MGIQGVIKLTGLICLCCCAPHAPVRSYMNQQVWRICAYVDSRPVSPLSIWPRVWPGRSVRWIIHYRVKHTNLGISTVDIPKLVCLSVTHSLDLLWFAQYDTLLSFSPLRLIVWMTQAWDRSGDLRRAAMCGSATSRARCVDHGSVSWAQFDTGSAEVDGGFSSLGTNGSVPVVRLFTLVVNRRS